MVDIVKKKKHEKSKRVLEVEEFNTLIVATHSREDSLLVEFFINMPKEQQVLISLANAMTSLPNDNLL
jgi:uncharacterized membrane protein YfhO